ncbi:hypothetical protein C8J36_11422 [Rhizobium sp. PP-F2F-G48]|nr:hypothetical protein C8J36_11422 [Rhizobium sp. PP-F2F-G48]
MSQTGKNIDAARQDYPNSASRWPWWFHSGLISTVEVSADGVAFSDAPDLARFAYVYDCGSERSDAFNAELALYRSACSAVTDILLVSHLHADHINGIGRLQAMAPAKTVVVPYLDVLERLLFVLSDFEQGTASRSSLDYFADPAEWWLGKGAVRVIFLQPGRPDDIPPSRDAGPDVPIDRPDGGRRLRLDEHPEKQPASRLVTYLKAAEGTSEDGPKKSDTTIRETEEGALIAASGSYFQLEWQDMRSDIWRQGDWILSPYVHPVEDPARKRFFKEIKKAIDFRGNDGAKLAKALLEKLRSVRDAKKLVEIYNRHFAGGHNAISMSLYSGPLSRTSNQAHLGSRTKAWQSSLEAPASGHWFWTSEGIGWLGTGDAALRQDKWREPWQTFFKHLDDRISVLTLPHHGSTNNFNRGVLDFPRLEFALATTVEARNRVARLRETLGTVEAHGICAMIVDDQRLSRFTITCERNMY